MLRYGQHQCSRSGSLPRDLHASSRCHMDATNVEHTALDREGGRAARRYASRGWPEFSNQGEQVKGRLLPRARSQGGFTLIELIITSALGVLVLSGLTSVVLTSVRA